MFIYVCTYKAACSLESLMEEPGCLEPTPKGALVHISYAKTHGTYMQPLGCGPDICHGVYHSQPPYLHSCFLPQQTYLHSPNNNLNKRQRAYPVSPSLCTLTSPFVGRKPQLSAVQRSSTQPRLGPVYIYMYIHISTHTHNVGPKAAGNICVLGVAEGGSNYPNTLENRRP